MPTSTALSFPALLRKVQAAGQDREWYPTTNEILTLLKKRVAMKGGSFLDIGAGNAKVLDAVRDVKGVDELYGIEQSLVLQNHWPSDVHVLGVNFHHSWLNDKEVDMIFCNPPYSEYEVWAHKIINEAPAGCTVWLVLPQRWKDCRHLEDVVKIRGVTARVLGSFDFEDAEDRKARAKVDFIEIEMKQSGRRKNRRWGDDESNEESEDADPFVRFFNETFQFPTEGKAKEKFKEPTIEDLVSGRNLIDKLVRMYEMEMERLNRNYSAICTIELSILKEFSISRESLIESLRQKTVTLKKKYWQEVFDRMREVTNRLTSKSRKEMVNKINSKSGLEFNVDNCYAVIMWAVRNANTYLNNQVCELFEKIAEHANVENYASNKRVFIRDRYRYGEETNKDNSHFRLKVGHRMVLEYSGGLRKGWDGSTTGYDAGLTERAAEFISDILTVARTLGFNVISAAPVEREWKTNSARFLNHRDGNDDIQTLVEVRCFFNSNMHMRFDPGFLHKINTIHGRLKGWLRSDAEAAKELQIPQVVARKAFEFDMSLKLDSMTLLTNEADPNCAIA